MIDQNRNKECVVLNLAEVDCWDRQVSKFISFVKSEEQSMRQNEQNMEVKRLLLSVFGRNSVQVNLISIHFTYDVHGFSSMSIPT